MRLPALLITAHGKAAELFFAKIISLNISLSADVFFRDVILDLENYNGSAGKVKTHWSGSPKILSFILIKNGSSQNRKRTGDWSILPEKRRSPAPLHKYCLSGFQR